MRTERARGRADSHADPVAGASVSSASRGVEEAGETERRAEEEGEQEADEEDEGRLGPREEEERGSDQCTTGGTRPHARASLSASMARVGRASSFACAWASAAAAGDMSRERTRFVRAT